MTDSKITNNCRFLINNNVVIDRSSLFRTWNIVIYVQIVKTVKKLTLKWKMIQSPYVLRKIFLNDFKRLRMSFREKKTNEQ